MVRLTVLKILLASLAIDAALPSPRPAPVQAQPSDQYFSGTVTKLEEGRITVTRTVLGKEDATRTFVVTAETRTEGKPRVKARVTVRFVSGDDGDRAVHILVRPAGKK